MTAYIETLFSMHWQQYVDECPNPTLKDFVQWLEEQGIDTDEYVPVPVNTSSWQDLTTN